MMGAGPKGKKKKTQAKSDHEEPANGTEIVKTSDAKGPTVSSPAGTDEDEDNDDELGMVFLVRTQLESLSLGVVSLAQCTLREPKLGESRQQRLEREQELIEHLKATRHWITHKTAPGGWDPQKLLSLGLQCTHPADPLNPLPQLPKTVLGIEDKPKAESKTNSKSTPRDHAGEGRGAAFVRAGRNLVQTEPPGGASLPKPPSDAKSALQGANSATLQRGPVALAGLGGTSPKSRPKDLSKLEGQAFLRKAAAS